VRVGHATLIRGDDVRTGFTGRSGTRVEALPIERTVEILKKYNALRQDKLKN